MSQKSANIYSHGMESTKVTSPGQHPVPVPRQSHPARVHADSQPSAQGAGPPVNSGKLTEQITVTKREVSLIKSEFLSQDYDGEFRKRRASFVREYLSDSRRLDLCAALMALDLPLDKKYQHLKLSKILDLNKEKSKFLRLPQGLGILEKYASNLIKTQRPPYWRSVKFTSPFVRTHVSGLSGSRDILFLMGYTEDIQDGVSFPEDVREPDVLKLRDMAADLFLARYEIDALILNRHPYFNLFPPFPSQDTAEPVSGSGSATQVPKLSVSSPAIQGPVPQSSRSVYHTGKAQLQQAGVRESPREPSNSTSVDLNTDSDGDSEYEDAEDGVPSAVLPVVPQADQPTSDVDTAPKFQCRVCGDSGAGLFCVECRDTFCTSCDSMFHKHPSRQQHCRSKVVTPQNQVKAVTPVTPSPVPEIPSTRKRPVPAPRSTVPRLSSSRTGQVPQTVPRQQKGLPSPPMQTTAGQYPATTSDVIAKATPSCSAPQRVSSSQNRTREILRPPPFTRSFTPVAGSTPFNSVGVEDSGVGAEGVPPQLPPKARNRQTVFVSTDTGLPPDVHAPASPLQMVLSCPNCFCLNAGDATVCVVCKRPLTNTNTPEQQKISAVTESSSSEGMSKVTSPVPSKCFPVSTFQEHAVQGYQLTPRHTENARQFPFGNHGVSAPVTPRREDDRSILQRPPRSHGDLPLASGNSTKVVNKAHSLLEAGEWSCEYCTLINPGTTHICHVCSKTRSTLPSVQHSAVKVQKPVQSGAEQRLSSQLSPPSGSVPEKRSQSSIITGLQKERERVVIEKEEAKREYELRRLKESSAESVGASTGGPPPHIPAESYANPGPLSEDPSGPTAVQYFSESAPLLHQNMAPDQFLPYQYASKNMMSTEGYLPDESQIMRREQEEIYIGGLQMVEWMKMAEIEGFQAEELNIATVLGFEDQAGPIHWLKNAWYDLVHIVLVRATEEAQDLGNLTPEEARSALIECTGDVPRAVVQCLDERRKKLTEISQNGVYPRTECVDVLDKHDGDVQKALTALERRAMEPVLQRVLDSCLPDDVPDEQFMVHSRILDSQESHETGTFETTVTDKDQDVDRRIRVILVEKNLASWGRAKTAVKLIDMNFCVEDAVEAACACGDLQRALRYLKQECPLCTDEKPMGQMITFLHCQHRFCRECVSQYFSITIKDQNIKNLVCPDCGEPSDLDNDVVATEYFNNLDIMIRRSVDKEIHDLFQRKLRDRSLVKEPNFRWCQHCSSGFINEQPDGIKMTCPHCRKHSCFKCKQKWEDQHDGVSCEQFAAWKEANDPERQAAGLAAHLKKNGIECPNCKFRYDLAKGGCMHFKCVQCPHEFCSGCYNPYKRGENCGANPSCARLGLHTHHPRDCLFYMRDFPVKVLQQLLRGSGVEYDTEPPQDQPTDNREESSDSDLEEQVQANAQLPNQTLYCKVMEQKETDNGLVDGECGNIAPANYAGLCKDHYQEYLVGLVNDKLIDPADIMSTDDLNTVLQRQGLAPVERGQEQDDEYKERVLQFVKERLPLPRLPPRKRVLGDDELQHQEAPVVEPANLLALEDFREEDAFGD